MTTHLRIITGNDGLDGTWTASSAVSTLPASNLTDPARGVAWRAAGCVSETLTVDLGEARAIAGLAFIDANLTTAAVVTISANTVDTWPGAWSMSLPVWGPGVEGVLVWFPPATQTYRRWRWTIADPTNPAGYVQVGKVVLGSVLDFADLGRGVRGPALGGTYARVDPSLRGTAANGTPYALARPKKTRLTIPSNMMGYAYAFETLWPALEAVGATTDLVLSMLSDDPGGTAIARRHNVYGRLEALPVFQAPAPFWNADLVLVEG